MSKTLYGDGTHTVTVDDETGVVQLVEDRGDGVLRVVDMSDRAFGEVVIGWQRWRERGGRAKPPTQVVAVEGIASAEEHGNG